MEPTSIFVKTEIGREEIRLRSQGLTARERATLIMVDGKRSVADLCMMSPTPAEVQRHLQAFLESGLIAGAGESNQSDTLHGASLSQNMAASTAAMEAAGAQPALPSAPPGADLEKARQYILEVAEETLGSDAASFTDQLARLHSTEEMLNLARHLRDVLYRFTNVQEADQFLETVREIAPKA